MDALLDEEEASPLAHRDMHHDKEFELVWSEDRPQAVSTARKGRQKTERKKITKQIHKPEPQHEANNTVHFPKRSHFYMVVVILPA